MAGNRHQSGNEKNGAPLEAPSLAAVAGAKRRRDQTFLAQALHQPLAATLFCGNSVHGP